MNSNLRFSIVTPSFNQGAYLEEALLSVSNQKPTPFEHLVMDGGSQDSSLDILQRHSPGREGHLRWRSASDRGQSHALNEGFLRATGDIVGWLISDDRYRPGCFEAVSRAFREYPEADIIYGDYTWIDERGRLLRIRREIEFSYFVLLYHRVLYIPTTATFFPGVTLAMTAAWCPVPITSDSVSKDGISASSTSVRSGKRVPSANGIRTPSACAPATSVVPKNPP